MKKSNLDVRFIVALVAALVFAVLFFVVLLTGSGKGIADPESVKSKIGHMGEVISYEVVPSTGLTAWLIKPKDLDRQFIFYSTPNGKALLTGSIWDAETGAELSAGIKLVQESMAYNQQAGQAELENKDGSAIDAATAQDEEVNSTSYASIDGNGEALGKYDGEVPLIFNFLDKFKGFKTSEASAVDTVYVFYDPRCPVCKESHDLIDKIDLKSKNIAVKWLPTVALGNTEDGRKRAAVALQTTDYTKFSNSIGGNELVENVSDVENKYIDDNLAILLKAAKETYGKDYKAKVPAAIYLNKETGSPKLLFGITNPQALKTIFGE